MLAVLGTALALYFFNRLIKETSAIYATYVTYLIPVVALVIGFLDNEKIAFNQIAGMTLIITGVYLVNRARARQLAANGAK
jgi:drug/metabolite transporter (DMT)-like permease